MKQILPRPLIALPLTLLSLGLLSACGSKEGIGSASVVVKQNYIMPQIDESLRNCKDRPAKRAVVTNVDVANVITDFGEYGDDCKSKHDATWKTIDEAKARVEALNGEPVP